MLFHKVMLADKERVGQLRKAIFKAVRPGDIVIDIGTGTGILSFFACQAGAKKVYAIETGDIIETARAIANDNGLGDKIVFINKLANEFDIDEKADVIVSELIASFGFEEGITKIVSQLKNRYLKKTGKLMPQKLSLHLLPVYDDKFYQEISFWDKDLWGIQLRAGKKFAANEVYSVVAGNILTNNIEPVFTYDFIKDDYENISFDYQFLSKPKEMLYGFLGWFQSELSDDVTLSNKPGAKTCWEQAFFPLECPIKLDGEEVNVKFDGFFLEKRFCWSWKTKVITENNIVKYEFSQTNISINRLNNARKHIGE